MQYDFTKKCKWYIDFSKNQKCMHIESEFDVRSRPHSDWELVETFHGTMSQANEQANKFLAKALGSTNK